ncbi:hypothetical protein [Desulfovibrio cuneatus]|uniref:hypothetical protein n=1 Tax=Desulfovibrio cuneatus TaxID=159728 RepID=UPI0012EBD2B3|nr:hypothetical protein [Desulfovibrio cuneatus]
MSLPQCPDEQGVLRNRYATSDFLPFSLHHQAVFYCHKYYKKAKNYLLPYKKIEDVCGAWAAPAHNPAAIAMGSATRLCLCLACHAEEDKTQTAFSGYNRKGSKDSQLR